MAHVRKLIVFSSATFNVVAAVLLVFVGVAVIATLIPFNKITESTAIQSFGGRVTSFTFIFSGCVLILTAALLFFSSAYNLTVIKPRHTKFSHKVNVEVTHMLFKDEGKPDSSEVVPHTDLEDGVPAEEETKPQKDEPEKLHEEVSTALGTEPSGESEVTEVTEEESPFDCWILYDMGKGKEPPPEPKDEELNEILKCGGKRANFELRGNCQKDN